MRDAILKLVTEFHKANWPATRFVPGETPVPVSGRVFDADELVHLVDASLDFWLTTGRYADRLERELASYVRTRFAVLCNSGSSANLLAVSALTSPLLGDQKLSPGDEVITVAAGFPTTVAPLVQNGLVPVFVDIELPSYNVDVSKLQEAIGPRTRALMFAHTLGNPFNVDAVRQVANDHDLWLIEDDCDALGSQYGGIATGSFGDLASVSFYPAHQMTTGEGGCVFGNSPKLKTLVESFRDWGRDCWCAPGKDNTCGKRFEWQLGGLPFGYDHKYSYSHLGYNLKLTDLQAAIGVAQLRKLPGFVRARRRNWRLLRERFQAFEEFFVLPEPTPNSEPSWFGFALTIREGAPFGRREFVKYLESRRIATRQLFAGNLVHQPAFDGVSFRVSGDLKNTDLVMNQTLWLGVFPGVTDEMIDYVCNSVASFVRSERAL